MTVAAADDQHGQVLEELIDLRMYHDHAKVDACVDLYDRVLREPKRKRFSGFVYHVTRYRQIVLSVAAVFIDEEGASRQVLVATWQSDRDGEPKVFR